MPDHGSFLVTRVLFALDARRLSQRNLFFDRRELPHGTFATDNGGSAFPQNALLQGEGLARGMGWMRGDFNPLWLAAEHAAYLAKYACGAQYGQGQDECLHGKRSPETGTARTSPWSSGRKPQAVVLKGPV